MRLIADLHIHSKYSRATSPEMEVERLVPWARRKGIDILATGDCFHPLYFSDLKNKLEEDGTGLLKLKGTHGAQQGTRFMLSGEISCIYKDKEKTRRLHILILALDFSTIEKIISELTKRGCNLKSDGRPIIGLSAKALAQICFEANEKTLVIPAHAWTPWFAIFGSKSGYDSIEECYEELTPHIYAIETGLSSDPAMNWRLSQLDKVALISNSDAHSPANLGREANVFDLNELTYDEIFQAVKNKDPRKFLFTVEFFPQEGKYHFDGHRLCRFVCSPAESKRYKNICPKCKKELVLGVDHRVDDLADRPVEFQPERAISFKSIIPLMEIIAECLGKKKSARAVIEKYNEIVSAGASEFNVLLDLARPEIEKIAGPMIGEAIMRMREGKVTAQPGYDGEYGVIRVFSNKEIKKCQPFQQTFF
jgi:uncharacterized protein (TIGR00375 family)